MLRRPSRADWSSSTISSVALEALSVVCKLINSNLDIPQINSAVRENGLAAFGRAAKEGQGVGNCGRSGRRPVRARQDVAPQSLFQSDWSRGALSRKFKGFQLIASE